MNRKTFICLVTVAVLGCVAGFTLPLLPGYLLKKASDHAAATAYGKAHATFESYKIKLSKMIPRKAVEPEVVTTGKLERKSK